MIEVDQFRRIAFAYPFTTFAIHLRDGRRLLVVQDFATIIYPDGDHAKSACLLDERAIGPFEEIRHYRISEIEHLELRPDLPWWDHERRCWRRPPQADAAA